MEITVKVIPGSKRSQITKVSGIYLIRVTAPPVKGEANKAMIKLLAQYFKVAKSEIDIIKGLTSKTKIINIG